MKRETWNLLDVNFGGRAPAMKTHETICLVVEEQAEELNIKNKRAIKKVQDEMIHELETYEKTMPEVYTMAKKGLLAATK